MKLRLKRIYSLGALISLLLLLASCKTYSQQSLKPVKAPEKFSKSGEVPLPDRFWQVFEDKDLNRLVERAFRGNFDLKAIWTRLKEARAITRRESAGLIPDIDGFGSASYDRRTHFGDDREFELGLSAEYEVDLWGRIQSRIEAEEFRMKASRHDFQTAAITLSAQVVRVWLRLLEGHQQKKLIESQIESNSKVLKLVRAQFRTGQARRADVLRQRQLVESTRELLHIVESRIGVLEHEMSLLLGKAPQKKIAYQTRDLPTLPPLPNTGLPMDLIKRRPDIRAAFHRLKAADSDLAAAISDQYPRLTLSISGSTVIENAEDLFQDWAASLAAELIAPIIDGGRLRAEVDRNAAIRERRLYEYGQQILVAFGEVEDALVLELKQRDRIKSLEEQVRLGDETYNQLKIQYINGTTEYIDVLNTLTQLQELRRNLLSARLDLLEFRIGLYRALAGGFKIEIKKK